MDLFSERFDLQQVCEAAGVSQRTVRYYIQQGLLPSPEARGPGSHYGAEHVDRLRVIKRWQRQHLPLAEIRRRLEGLREGEIRQLATGLEEPPAESARDYIRGVLREPTTATSPLGSPALGASMAGSGPPKQAGMRSQWDRIALSPDVELHVRRPLDREQNRRIERLVQAARTIFEEDD